LHPAKAFTRASERNETETVAEDLVLDDGGVVVHEDIFDGYSRDFGQHDTTVCVCDRGVDADEREDRVVLVILVEVDLEFLGDGQRDAQRDSRWSMVYLFEGLEVPRVVLARVMTRKIGGNYIRDGFGVDADKL